MSTNAVISILDEGSRTLTSIGLSCDGYLSHAGKILLEHYNSEKRAKQLMKLGNLFALNPKIAHNLPTPKEYWAIPIHEGEFRNIRLNKFFGERLDKACIPFHYYSPDAKVDAVKKYYPSDLVGDIESVLSNLYPWNEHHYVWHYRHWLYPTYKKDGTFAGWKPLNKQVCEKK